MNLKAWLWVWISHAGWYVNVSTKHCPMCPWTWHILLEWETAAPIFKHQQSDSSVFLEMGLEKIALAGEWKHQQTRNDLNVFFLPLDIPSLLKTHKLPHTPSPSILKLLLPLPWSISLLLELRCYSLDKESRVSRQQKEIRYI